MNNMNKKFISGLLGAVMSLYMMDASVMPAFAAEASAGKEEVVYIMTDAEGTAQTVQIVNSFPGGTITDYGNYSAVKMLTATDNIQQKGDTVTFSSSDAKVYYQGTLKQAEIPWNIEIQYYMDGREYEPSEMAGKSGKLEIQFSVSKNEGCTASYYEDYALQAAFVLDTNRCSNIVAEDATEANIGADKQLTYTILPGKGIKTAICADVSDFEMAAVTINGIKLNLNVDIDETELMDKVRKLMDATKEIDQGTEALYTATDELKSGSNALMEGAESLHSGAGDLDLGITALQSGISALQTGIDTLNSQSNVLTDGSAQIKNALAEVTENMQGNVGYEPYRAILEQNGLDLQALQAGNEQAVVNLSDQIASLQDTLLQIENEPGMEVQAAQLRAQIQGLQAVVPLLSGNIAAINATESYFNELSGLTVGLEQLSSKYGELDAGIQQYTNGVERIAANYGQVSDGVSALSVGSHKLLEGSAELSAGTDGFSDGIVSFRDGASEMKGGTKELYTQTANMDSQAQDKMDEMLASIQGEETETVSFASEKNKNVESVQFVLKTSAIEKSEKTETAVEQKKEQTVWEKLWKLIDR